MLRSRRAQRRAWSSRSRDRGEGFAPDFAERAFERFARGDLRTRTRDGAGLGLSIVRTIAEAHGGRAEVVAGAGATVRIWLPDRPETASGPSKLAGVASRAQGINP